MLFWIAAAFLTLGACLAVLMPLVRKPAVAIRGKEHDLEVYRDQLSELDRDAARGVIDEAEAAEARTEIARRILRADADGDSGAVAGPLSSAGRWLALTAILAVPLVSWGFYSVLGSPDLPAQPLEARLTKNPADSTIDELVARAEAHLAANPGDGRGWDVLAPIYVRMERSGDAVVAYRNAIRLLGASARRETGLGEAIAAAAGGIVTADAQAAFERALKIEPQNAKARFFIGTAKAQERKFAEAIETWEAILADAAPDSPWRSAAEQAIAAVNTEVARSEAPTDRSAAEQPGPDEADIAAAQGMSEADRNAMIQGMVAKLDARLRENPADIDGWKRLIRSYMVLGKTDAAADAVTRGAKALETSGDGAKELQAFAASLGVPVPE